MIIGPLAVIRSYQANKPICACYAARSYISEPTALSLCDQVLLSWTPKGRWIDGERELTAHLRRYPPTLNPNVTFLSMPQQQTP